jgi:hypothetical protein
MVKNVNEVSLKGKLTRRGREERQKAKIILIVVYVYG